MNEIIEIIKAFVITIAMILFAIMVAKGLLQSLSSFIYFFVRDSSEMVSDTVSGLSTVVAGTPGEVMITYENPSEDYKYDVHLTERSVFISSERLSWIPPIGLKLKEIEDVLKKVPSTTGVKITPETRYFEDLNKFIFLKKEGRIEVKVE